jgi:hypothetical protein
MNNGSHARLRLTRILMCALISGTVALLPLGRNAAAAEAGASSDRSADQASQRSPREQAFLDQLQRDTFRFFWEATPAGTGLTPDRTTPDRTPGSDVASVAGVGFALTSYTVGAERGYVTRAEAATRTLATLQTLWQAPQGQAPVGVSGHSGLYYHFLDARDGVRAYASELSTIDTALLMAGVLSSQAYFDGQDETEQAIRALADKLYRRVDWASAYSPKNRPLLSLGWTPEEGFIDYDWSGYSEGMLLYVLALGSPTHPIEQQAWEQWTRSYRWESSFGPPHVTFGPMFGHQYSHVWIDFRGIQDGYMRSKGSDYFTNSVRATHANRAYCIANPGRWKGYGELVWGVTASDGPPGPKDGGAAPFRGYWARGVSADAAADDGTIAPTAVGGSVPFAPEVTIPTLMGFRERFGDRLYGKYGFKDAFNLSHPSPPGAPPGWFDEQYLAIDQGPILLMIENYRSGFVWELLKKSPYVTAGLRKAGFSGGWLDSPSARPDAT